MGARDQGLGAREQGLGAASHFRFWILDCGLQKEKQEVGSRESEVGSRYQMPRHRLQREVP